MADGCPLFVEDGRKFVGSCRRLRVKRQSCVNVTR